MDRRQGVDRFNFDHDLPLHQQVEPEADVEPRVPVLDRNGDLPVNSKARLKQFLGKAVLMDGLEQTGAKASMDRERGFHHRRADAIHIG